MSATVQPIALMQRLENLLEPGVGAAVDCIIGSIMTVQHIQAEAARQKRLTADLMLLGVAAVWGFAFVAQRLAAAEIGVLTFYGWRFLVGALALTPLLVFRNRSPKDEVERAPAEQVKTRFGLLLAGVLLTLAATFQQAGLKFTSAGNAGFISGLYVVLIPIFLAVGWRRAPSKVTWLAAVLAAGGLFLLSTGGRMQFNQGDLLVLVSAVFWALHVMQIDWMVKRMDVVQFAAGQYLVCGLISLGLGLALEGHNTAVLLENWWPIAYTGLISIALGYTLQAAGQRFAPPADAAIILSMEAVFATFSGWVFLQENLTWIQIAGGGTMLLGMLLAQRDVIPGNRNAQSAGG